MAADPPAGAGRRSFEVPPEADGERLDRFLAGRLEAPRNRVAGWIREGRVELEGREARPASRLKAGETVRCEPRPVDAAEELTAEEGPLAVIWEDADLAVLDKPPGLVVHPGAGRPRGTLVHRLLARYPETARVGGPGRPGIVHRLDRGTSGLLVVALSDAAYRGLTAAFAERRVDKTYLAIVYGEPRPASGTLDAPIGRHPRRRKEMTVTPGGRAARTGYRTLGAGPGISLLALTLATGRTHQIRVHLKDARWPLVGDPVYGEARWKALPRALRRPLRLFPRPALHAWRLGFAHPVTDEPLEFEAPPPADLRRLWQEVTGEEMPLPGALPERA